MEFRFLTLPAYDGKIIQTNPVQPATGGAAAWAWEEDASEGPYQLVFKKVREILTRRSETVEHLARLKYDDLTGFGNTLYRIDGSKQQYFLKILGDKQGNRREIFVWRILGYGKDGRRRQEVGEWIKGLPAEVHALAPLNAILTRYYPGQLHTVRGGSYEFPLVMAVVLYLDETLRGMHRHGLMFMDLCPDNILYLQDHPSRPMLFFLTDMGSVKAITGREGMDDNWEQLRDLVTADRWTRAEARPPENMFPQRVAQITEDHPGYDDHTLARTALLLLGFGQRHSVEGIDLSAFPLQINLETPFTPRRDEMTSFLDILAGPLRGEPVRRDRLYALFLRFFRDRADFGANFIDAPTLRDVWRDQLLQRLTRYKMVLTAEDKKDEPRRLLQTLAAAKRQQANPLSDELAAFNTLADCLLTGQLEKALETLPLLNQSRLPEFCPTARYALSYHTKLARALCREQGIDLPSNLTVPGDEIREQIPESETLAALRRGQTSVLGVLVRKVGL